MSDLVTEQYVTDLLSGRILEGVHTNRIQGAIIVAEYTEGGGGKVWYRG